MRQESSEQLLPILIESYIAYGHNYHVIMSVHDPGTICDSIYHALSNSILMVWINTTKSNGLIFRNYAFFKNLSIEGTIAGMVFLNLYTKCCCIFFKCMFCFDGLVWCGAFTEVYIGQFIKIVNKYCGNVIFSTRFLFFENWD